jgi:nuclear transport factor 2 (NTF2) superfamily protein
MDIISSIDDFGLREFFQDYVSRLEEIYFSKEENSKDRLNLAFVNISTKLNETNFLIKRDKVSEQLKFEEDMDEQLLKELYQLKKKSFK